MYVALNDRMFIYNELEGMLQKAVRVQSAAVPAYA
jgi:hypothetical protein